MLEKKREKMGRKEIEAKPTDFENPIRTIFRF
jgi:hypothetical protein